MAGEGQDSSAGAAVTAPAAYILILIAGVLVMINSLLVIAVGRSIDVVMFETGVIPGIAGVLAGLGMLFAAHRLNVRPAGHVALGTAVIGLSLISLALVGGGFILGSVLGVGGGVLAIAWKG